MKNLTAGKALIILAVAITLVAFGMQWRPGLVLEFLREGAPFDRFAIGIFVLLVFPPLVERFRLPGILGLIVGGLIIGPSILGIAPKSNEVATFFGEIGRVFLMFLIGLEIDLRQFRRHAAASTIFGLATFCLPMIAGTATGRAFGYGPNASILIGSLLASHTLLAMPVLEKLGLTKHGFSLAAVGATIFTDIASLLVLALCVSAHVTGGLSLDHLGRLLFGLGVYCVLVLGAIPWIGQAYLKRRDSSEAAQFQFVMLALIISAVGAKLIELEDIVGAFLCGIAINQVLGHGPARDKLEFLGKAFFVPLFFVLIGVSIDLKAFLHCTMTQFPFVVAIVGCLLGGKLLAAAAAKFQQRYSWPEGLTLWSLSLPQLAATLAAAVTAYKTVDATGARLIDETVINAVIVLMTVTAILGPMLTQRFGQRVSPAPAAAQPVTAKGET